ncbi:energy transducer TonB [Flammeovirga sp. SubArs3]|uniref:energy transducer TonB n=1 Tax=Flammeovirga sp. SubArs3 TaxID=2995316 RepID=UPI00248ADAC2|nr:energy transducer TonB [Flammeovirga sp. SubArs3]
MRKTTLAFLLFLITSISSLGQSIIYFNEDHTEVMDKNDAVYYANSHIGELENEKYKHTTFYLDGTIYSTYYTKEKKRYKDKFGDFESYYKNGNLKEKGVFDASKKVGIWHYYHSNSQENFSYEMKYKEGEFEETTLFINAWDSLGNQTVKNGNGQLKYLTKNSFYQEGMVKNKLKTGEWNGTYIDGKPYFIETYKNGKLKKGNSWDSEGKKYSYTKTYKRAFYPGGIWDFYNWIGKVLRYPDDAKKQGIEGKVYVAFIVDKSGQLTEINVVKGVYESMDQEVLRVMQLVKPWSPAKKRGQKTISRMILPISFRLS